jgi:two-component system LytT family response regulator
MSINALIVDDEEYSCKSLYFLINAYCPEIIIKALASSVAEARKKIRSENIELVFLDIAMPVEDGFSLLPDLKEYTIPVIFTTAHDSYALKALKASAVDYLLKPIDAEDLKSSIEKVLYWKKLEESDKIKNGINSGRLSSLEENLNGINKITKINLPNSNGFQILDINNILYVNADSNYSVFHLNTHKSIIVSKHLKEYQEILENSGFFRIHKSTLINLNYLTDYSNKNKLIVRLSDGSEHTVARRKVSGFLKTIKLNFKR